MNDLNQNFINSTPINSYRLEIKNIPENLSNEQLTDILNKNFENKLKDISIIKLEHKYNLKNNKICFLTVDNFELRKKLINFFSTIEIVDPKGFKQKLIVVDCLFQNKGKSNKDSVEGSINQSKFNQIKLTK
jgi:hypothetical protein